jgi:DNA invertase Pin-like site-specific DNA recombinase
VELRGCYSNPEAQEAVALAEQAIDALAAEGTPPCPSAPVRRWRLADRLDEQIIRKLLADQRSGATRRELVERYGISMSSVKRILRRK